jgi:hypothetical protein
MNTEELAKRLLALGQYGCHLHGQDGHIWIEPAYNQCDGEEEENHSDLHYVLKKAGVGLNNKIYGGVLEALDTIDEALRLAGIPSLLSGFSGWDHNGSLFLGEPGIGKGRIDIYEKGIGGLN